METKSTSNQTSAQITAYNSKTQYAELNGRKLAYRSIGKGPAIILVNRFRGTLDTWDPLFLDNLAQNFRVITFDYTGIGHSSGTLPTDLSFVAQDIKDLATHLNLSKITVMGWSYGGLVSQITAIKFPKLVEKLILIGTGPLGKREVPLEPLFLETAIKPEYDLNDEIILFFEPLSESSKKEAQASHDRIAQRIDRSKVPSAADVLQRYVQGAEAAHEDKAGMLEELKATTIPILVVSGDHDISFAIENWFPLLRILTTAQFIIFPLTGHAPQHQFPGLVANYINSFLKE
ncbi:alpha/beta hydrolase [Flavobacterium akiainvivens]|uniref:Alpha/beta hydrolase n=1 Tax=Flavobacterium akiainvivens TaxID=1202724 RepID=A0A0M9VGT7_9FLAO|nr:alpha/beta hydrolase [Flavobacterium akiainvivens]KOS04840.1 alpha/beta hydrolase [Flavobacterium akiainvivens]SFQ43432.1 Pimeloyl-ACP methyl ester carboxylesterase [Flavobacterium akiainvivens]